MTDFDPFDELLGDDHRDDDVTSPEHAADVALVNGVSL